MDDLTAQIRQLKEEGKWSELKNLFDIVRESDSKEARHALVEAFEQQVEACIVDATADVGNPEKLFRAAIQLSEKILLLKPCDVATIGRQAFCEASLAEMTDDPDEAAALAEAALSQYDEAIVLGPRDGSIRASKAGALISLGKRDGSAEVILEYFTEAFSLYRSAIEVEEPSWHFFTWREAIDYLERHADARVSAFAAEARDIYNGVLDLVRDSPQALSKWAECLTQMGSLQLAHGDEEGAQRLFEEALEMLCNLEALPASNPRIHTRAGRNFEAIALSINTRAGDLLRKAIEQYRKTIELDPEDSYAYFYTAQACEQLGRVENDATSFEAATKIYQEAIEAQAVDHGLLLSYGRHLYKLSRIAQGESKRQLLRDSAQRYLHALLLGLDDNMRPYHMLARIWKELGDDDKAYAIFGYGLDGFWRCFDFTSIQQMERFAELREDPRIVEMLRDYAARDNLAYTESEQQCLLAAQLVNDSSRKLNVGINALAKFREALAMYDANADGFFEHMRHGLALVDFAGFTGGDERHKSLKRAATAFTAAVESEPDLFPNPYAELIYIHQLMGRDSEAKPWLTKMQQKFGTCFGLGQ